MSTTYLRPQFILTSISRTTCFSGTDFLAGRNMYYLRAASLKDRLKSKLRDFIRQLLFMVERLVTHERCTTMH
jgi:hypothetical protein